MKWLGIVLQKKDLTHICMCVKQDVLAVFKKLSVFKQYHLVHPAENCREEGTVACHGVYRYTVQSAASQGLLNKTKLLDQEQLAPTIPFASSLDNSSTHLRSSRT